jgi:hypothetical protein
MTDYKATPEQWGTDPKRWPEAILELRAKVKALEDENWKQAESIRFCFDALVKRIEVLEAISKPTSNPSQIRGSLLHRVADAIAKEDWMNSGLDESACQCDDPTYRYTSRAIDAGLGVGSLQARAAIREVLAYLCEHELIGNYARRQLEQEAEQ